MSINLRPSLWELYAQIDGIDTDNLYEAMAEVKAALKMIVVQLEHALPLNVEPD